MKNTMHLTLIALLSLACLLSSCQSDNAKPADAGNTTEGNEPDRNVDEEVRALFKDAVVMKADFIKLPNGATIKADSFLIAKNYDFNTQKSLGNSSLSTRGRSKTLHIDMECCYGCPSIVDATRPCLLAFGVGLVRYDDFRIAFSDGGLLAFGNVSVTDHPMAIPWAECARKRDPCDCITIIKD